jgi:hypothetical protein
MLTTNRVKLLVLAALLVAAALGHHGGAVDPRAGF